MIWAIGDIHGMFDPLKRLLAEIRLMEESDDPLERVIFIGDYIDHGPSSKEVIDLLRRLDFETVLLAGNHEDMALRFIKQDRGYLENYGNNWFLNGAADTCLSFRRNAKEAGMDLETCRLIRRHLCGILDYKGFEIPKVYERFLSSLKYSHLESVKMGSREVKVSFIHGIPSPLLPFSGQLAKTRKEFNFLLETLWSDSQPQNKRQKEELKKSSRKKVDSTYIWGRDYDLENGYDGQVVVHGHDPAPLCGSPPNIGLGERPELSDQFQRYPLESLLPFLFSRSPGARYERADLKMTLSALKSLGASRSWLRENPEAWNYLTEGQNGVEAINIDTGAVIGGGLTAVGLSAKYLGGGFLMSLMCPSGGNLRRRQEKVLRRIIKFTRLVGNA